MKAYLRTNCGLMISHEGVSTMVNLAQRSTVLFPLLVLTVILLTLDEPVMAQKKPATIREFLLQYKGKDILMLDRTTGVEQFIGGDASKAYNVLLTDVQNDYFVVTRNTDSDKRTFVYPLTIIRRIIYLYDGRPYQKIVVEMY